MNNIERERIGLAKISHGHIRPALSGDYVCGLKCAYCGKVYRRKIANLHDHLQKAHNVAWWRNAPGFLSTGELEHLAEVMKIGCKFQATIPME